MLQLYDALPDGITFWNSVHIKSNKYPKKWNEFESQDSYFELFLILNLLNNSWIKNYKW
jgi:hypothetical protein